MEDRMDIMATGDGWAFPLVGLGGFKYGVDKKTGDLSLVIDPKAKHKRDTFMVETPRGLFIETMKDGEVIQEGGDGNWCHITVGKKPVTLRYKKLPDPGLSKRELDKCRKKVRRYLVDGQPYSAGVPDTLTGLVKWAEGLLVKIPASSRKDARCSFDTSSEYGETYPHVEVSYIEAETDDEVIERVKIERERARLKDISRSALN
jgi:hypothetical protein